MICSSCLILSFHNKTVLIVLILQQLYLKEVIVLKLLYSRLLVTLNVDGFALLVKLYLRNGDIFQPQRQIADIQCNSLLHLYLT